jgi:hypothetical protein
VCKHALAVQLSVLKKIYIGAAAELCLQVLIGTDALKALFSEVGLGWATKLADIPLVAWLVDALYNFLSERRVSFGGLFDGVIAAKRMEMVKEGKETCGDMDDECVVEW